MEEEERKKQKWYRIDNAATLFSMVESKRITTVFRLSVTLKKPINVSILQEALETIIERFPYYKVNLRPGFFWYYWNNNEEIPVLEKDTKYPNSRMNVKKKGEFPFRVKVYQNRIAIEYSHILTDGTGGMAFLKTLVTQYLSMQGKNIEDWGDVMKPGEKPDETEYEDAFKKYYKKTLPNPEKIQKAFHLPYKLEKPGIYHIITGIAPVEKVLEVARSHKVSITEYLAAVYIDVLQQIVESYPEKKQKKMRKPIRLMVPVNLRNIYPTKTMRNFSLYVTPGIDTRLGTYSFEEILKKVHHYMRMEVDEKYINQQIARNVRGELHPAIRATPLVLKNMFGKSIYNNLGEYLYSGVVTNLGKVTVPKEIEEDIERFEFFPAPSPVTKTNCAVGSYKDKLYLSFGRQINEKEVEKNFFRKLRKDGINIKIETNE